MHRREEESPVTEDDVNEVKMEISSMRYEILEIFEKNGMDISGAEKKEKTVLAKKMKVWERRLMKDFHVAGVPEEGIEEEDEEEEEPANLTGLARFKRAAQKVATSTATSKWGQVMTDVGVVTNSQIGRCRNRQSFKNQQNLQRAMEEARRLVTRSPISRSGSASPIDPRADDPGDTLMQLLKNMAADMQEISPGQTLCVDKKATKKKKGHSRSTTPVTSQLLQEIMSGKTPLPEVTTSKSPDVPKANERLCKSAASSVNSRQAELVKSPDGYQRAATPRSVGIASPPPVIQITEPATEALETIPEPAQSPPPLPTKTPSTPKKRIAPSPQSAAVSRPLPSKQSSSQGMIPPPPSRKAEPEKVTTPQPQMTVSVVKPPPADSIITIPRCESPLPTIVSITTKDDNMTITMESGGGSNSSLEKLVSSPGATPRTTPSPACLRPVRRIEDVTTIKRQPKTGWL